MDKHVLTEREYQKFYNRSRRKRDERYFIREIQEGINLYREPASGLAWILDITMGEAEISIHPNGIARGPIAERMKQCGLWGMNDRIVYCIGRCFNIDMLSTSMDEVYNVLFDECMCAACKERRSKEVTDNKA